MRYITLSVAAITFSMFWSAASFGEDWIAICAGVVNGCPRACYGSFGNGQSWTKVEPVVYYACTTSNQSVDLPKSCTSVGITSAAQCGLAKVWTYEADCNNDNTTPDQGTYPVTALTSADLTKSQICGAPV